MPRVIETEPRGLLFDFDDPRPEQVDIRDIARALSLSCRFGGLCKTFYSVAQHAVLVHDLVKERGYPAEICFAALHHDSHEAYLGDVVTPLKKKLGLAWTRLQWDVDLAISEKLGVDWCLLDHAAVKTADADALLIEAHVLKTSKGVGPQWRNDAPAKIPRGFYIEHIPFLTELAFRRVHDSYAGA